MGSSKLIQDGNMGRKCINLLDAYPDPGREVHLVSPFTASLLKVENFSPPDHSIPTSLYSFYGSGEGLKKSSSLEGGDSGKGVGQGGSRRGNGARDVDLPIYPPCQGRWWDESDLIRSSMTNENISD